MNKRTIISYYPESLRLKIHEPSGSERIITKADFEDSLIAGLEYTIVLKTGEYTFSKETYHKIKNKLWKDNN